MTDDQFQQLMEKVEQFIATYEAMAADIRIIREEFEFAATHIVNDEEG